VRDGEECIAVDVVAVSRWAIEIEIEIVYNMYRMRRFTPNTVYAGCCLWALPTMPYRELTSHG
jgi:hypothetical protein